MKKQVLMVRVGMAFILVMAMIAATGCTGLTPTDPAIETESAGSGAENLSASETPDASSTEDASVPGSEVKLEGTVESINGNTVVIDGVSYELPADVVAQLKVGDVVKLEAVVGADGSLTEVQIEVEDSETETPDMSETPEPTEAPEMTETPEATESEDHSGGSSDDGGSDDSSGGSSDSGGDD